MALRDEFEALRGGILHRTPLPKVDSVVNELLAEEIRLKSHSLSHLDKEIHTSPPSVFAAHSNKGKPQGRVDVGIDECAFCKQKGHWKSNCPQLMKAGRKNFKAPSSSVVAPPSVSSGIGSAYPSETNSHVFDLAEQFQKFLATQPHAMSASSIKGLNPSSLSGSTIREEDWDRP
ncbi:uncharacterized protein LOC123905293 [Trifolium pratense]|uniref:uncharacterized protein LOC123905293 n=1 Tax=Trifolium pratense TaxID=57577 RepID=UPI001E693518|nr:uncharacterized protein LOC123905293 [Trifolium pratense]